MVLKGIRKSAENSATPKGAWMKCQADSPQAFMAVISLVSENRPNVKRLASRLDIGNVNESEDGRSRKRSWRVRTIPTPLLIKRSTNSKRRSKTSTKVKI